MSIFSLAHVSMSLISIKFYILITLLQDTISIESINVRSKDSKIDLFDNRSRKND